jgi:hypothetical protein
MTTGGVSDEQSASQGIMQGMCTALRCPMLAESVPVERHSPTAGRQPEAVRALRHTRWAGGCLTLERGSISHIPAGMWEMSILLLGGMGPAHDAVEHRWLKREAVLLAHVGRGEWGHGWASGVPVTVDDGAPPTCREMGGYPVGSGILCALQVRGLTVIGWRGWILLWHASCLHNRHDGRVVLTPGPGHQYW